ncbi:hypothetical protein E5D57_000802 [Metarhizium anisopliae]|nr:hypothetical protein E5D57_000802 [Metarhizium anisopliae]
MRLSLRREPLLHIRSGPSIFGGRADRRHGTIPHGGLAAEVSRLLPAHLESAILAVVMRLMPP